MATDVYTGKQLKRRKDVADIFTGAVSSATKKEDTKIVSHDHEYDFSNRYRGLAVIISNGQFKESLPRPYCDDELRKMKETFGSKVLKFTVLAFKDLTAEQMGWVLDIASEQKEFHQKSDCFACVIASHGNERPIARRTKDKSLPKVYFREHCLYGADDLPITTKSAIERLSNTIGLENKPKLFFIQACRSQSDRDRLEDSVEPGYEIDINNIPPSYVKEHYRDIDKLRSYKNDEHQDTIVSKNEEIITGNSKQQDHEDVENKDIIEGDLIEKLVGWFKGEHREIIRILDPPCEDDCLIVYSSSSGKESFGRHSIGGWMLSSLHETMQNHIKLLETLEKQRVDMFSVLSDMSGNALKFETQLPKTVAYPERKATVVFEHGLYKELYFA